MPSHWVILYSMATAQSNRLVLFSWFIIAACGFTLLGFKLARTAPPVPASPPESMNSNAPAARVEAHGPIIEPQPAPVLAPVPIPKNPEEVRADRKAMDEALLYTMRLGVRLQARYGQLSDEKNEVSDNDWYVRKRRTVYELCHLLPQGLDEFPVTEAGNAEALRSFAWIEEKIQAMYDAEKARMTN
jgi:hypothetical protein